MPPKAQHPKDLRCTHVKTSEAAAIAISTQQHSTNPSLNHVVVQNSASSQPTTDPRPVLETVRGAASNGSIHGSKQAPFSIFWQSIRQERWLVCHKVQLTSIKAGILLCQAVHAKKSMTSSNNRDASWNPLLLPITEHQINTRPTQLRQSCCKRKDEAP